MTVRGEKTYFNIRGKPTPSRFARLTLSLVTGSGVLGSGTIHKMGIVYPFVEVAVEVTGDQETSDVRLSDVRLPSFRIVIPSAAEGSLSFAVKRTMFGKLNRETFGHRPIYASRRLDPSTQFSYFR